MSFIVFRWYRYLMYVDNVLFLEPLYKGTFTYDPYLHNSGTFFFLVECVEVVCKCSAEREHFIFRGICSCKYLDEYLLYMHV